MYKLMIVDDEFYIRDGIVNAVDWESIDVAIVGEAKSGKDALEKIPRLLPDIIITDICMDNISGLELIEILSKDYPKIKCIILSGYDDFEYAKKALELRVCSYLLKPILSKELKEIVKGLIFDIKKERSLQERVHRLETDYQVSREALIENFWNDMLSGRVEDEQDVYRRASYLGLDLSRNSYGIVLFCIDGYFDLSQNMTPKDIYLLLLGIKEIIYEHMKPDYDVYIITKDSDTLAAVYGQSIDQYKKHLSNVLDAIENIKNDVKSILNLTVSAGVGQRYPKILDIGKAYSEAESALEYKFITGKDSTIHVNDIVNLSGNRYIYPSDKEQKILNSINQESIDSVREGISMFFYDLENQKYFNNRLKNAIIELFTVITRKFMDVGIDVYGLYNKEWIDPYMVMERFDTIEELKNWLTNIVCDAINILSRERKDNLKSVIKKAQDYICRNYANPDISLISIAEHVFLNPAYFSKLYRKETGEHYIEFLTKIRLEEAKRLLKSTNLKTSDIGIKVGYSNAQYFCTLFKKYSGISPNEYREKKEVRI